MDFGRVSEQQLDKVDFTLRKDPAFNDNILNGKSVPDFRAYMGCAKWGRTEWVGSLYPLKTKEKDFLENYVKHYNSIELNATHYKVYAPEMIHKWADKAKGRNFKFCPKMVNTVTHYGRLNGKETITDSFLNGIIAFKEQLGPVFVQFSEHFSPTRKDELFSFLKSLPTDVVFFVEVRHPSWFNDKDISEELFNTLRTLKIGAVITDSAGHRECVHMHLPISKAFIRFVGNSLHPTDYTRIDEWADRIRYWKDRGLEELYFFMHMHDEAKSPELTAYVAKVFNEVCGLSIQEPKLNTSSQGNLFG